MHVFLLETEIEKQLSFIKQLFLYGIMQLCLFVEKKSKGKTHIDTLQISQYLSIHLKFMIMK